jgi:fructoselysine-6-P-deglycase FrlB-like protein
VLDGTGLWRDVEELPSSVEATLADTTGLERVAALLGGDSVRRIVASGNGASYYVAVALWLASLEGRERAPEVVAVPSGLLARGAFAWRPGDALLVVSSSGEFRDLVEAIDGVAPTAYAAVTANGDSTLGSRAAARALVAVPNQRALTHTQAFCGAVAAALAVWAKVTSDPALEASLRSLPADLERSVAQARSWVDAVGELDPEVAIVFGGGPAWAAALEAALLLKEVAGIPAEGVETREGATSAMMALRPGALALSLPTAADEPLLEEAETICAGRGAAVLRAPVGETADRRLAAVSTFPAAAALSARLGLERGLDIDAPDWTDAYYRAARPHPG